MNIVKTQEYKIKYYTEDAARDVHTVKSDGDLVFSGQQLFDAIITCGMPDVYLSKRHEKIRKKEIDMKVNMFEYYVKEDTNHYLKVDDSHKKYLDSSEVGAINYWVGMIITTLVGKNKYGFDYMVHLSKVGRMSTSIVAVKKTFLNTKGEKIYKFPDLLAVKRLNQEYGVFEAKGRSNRDNNVMEKAYDQAHSILYVNKKTPKEQRVIMTVATISDIRLYDKDPDGGDVEIDFDEKKLAIYYYIPIIELIDELGATSDGIYMTAQYEHGTDKYLIKVPIELYKSISEFMKAYNKDLESIESIIDKIKAEEDEKNNKSLTDSECGGEDRAEDSANKNETICENDEKSSSDLLSEKINGLISEIPYFKSVQFSDGERQVTVE